MFKYLFKCALNFTLCIAIMAGAAAALGVEYKLVMNNGDNAGGENAVVSYDKINESVGRLTLGQYTFNLDLKLLDGVGAKLGQYMDSALSYLPELAVKAGGFMRDIALHLGG